VPALRLPTALLLAAVAAAPAHAQIGAGTATREMEACAALGAKRPGTAAGRAMAGHLAERFRAAGLETRFEDFHLPLYRVREERIEVVGPNARAVPGETFAYGGSGTVEADVVDVGTGRSGDYAGKDVTGKIVMVDRNEAFHRSSQLNEIVAHGGAAMLYVSGSPDNLVQTGTVRFAQRPPAPVPTVTVGADDGRALRNELRSRGLRMRITVAAERVDGVGRNVIGVRRGTVHPDRYVVAAGHYDSWHGGAVDNCSSMGALLEVAEATRHAPPAYTVIFAAWDAEEVGLTGAYDFVQRHQDLIPKVVVDENFEMVSAASYVGGNRLDYSALNLVFGTTAPALNATIYGAAGRNGFFPAPTSANGVRAVSGGIIPTDLQPFYSSGVQGFSTFSSTPYYHTREESPDKIDNASLQRATAFLRDFLLDVQRVPPEALLVREIPRVDVFAPSRARAGAAVPVEVRVTDPSGRPVDDVPVRLLANQHGHWPVAESDAERVGAGHYRWTLPAGVTDADVTRFTATVDTPLYAAEGYARTDQRGGAVLPPATRTCRSRRVIRMRLRAPRGDRLRRARVRASRGRVLVRRRGRGFRVRLDLRGVPRGEVRVRVRVTTARGRTLRQTRTFRTCATRRTPPRRPPRLAR
jgi:Zn-dependent M28 family amino/carboxypeptidase